MKLKIDDKDSNAIMMIFVAVLVLCAVAFVGLFDLLLVAGALSLICFSELYFIYRR